MDKDMKRKTDGKQARKEVSKIINHQENAN